MLFAQSKDAYFRERAPLAVIIDAARSARASAFYAAPNASSAAALRFMLRRYYAAQRARLLPLIVYAQFDDMPARAFAARPAMPFSPC